MIDIDDLVKAVVARQMAKGETSSDARVYALGYLVSYVNRNLIDTAPAARQKLIAAQMAQRVADIQGETV
jgi:hypothetical protein